MIASFFWAAAVARDDAVDRVLDLIPAGRRG
jgi:hypothetical protein